MQRISKKIARLGICSRREAEKLIEQGRVCLNGKILQTPAVNIDEGDLIEIDGEKINSKEEPSRIFLYHKPAGTVTTAKDEHNRPTVFDNLPKNLPRLITIGRLDLNTEGLLLMTNDGELARHFELPSSGIKRTYRVRVHGNIDEKRLKNLTKGITIEGINYGSIEVEIDNKITTGRNHWLNVSLSEGKNREIRKVMKHLGLEVSRLIRISYGNYELGELKKGEIKEGEIK